MTSLQLISSLFGILIYPFLIRNLGAESYGLYVFALSVTTYYSTFITFGFSFPAVKAIVQNKDNLQIKNDVISNVFTAKIYLLIISSFVFGVLLFYIPIMKNNWLIFAISFTQIIGDILFPTWYFQGVQKMHVVTYIQLTFRILSVPFIFLFVRLPADCWIFVLISSLSSILGGITCVIFLLKNEKIKYRFVPLTSLKNYFKDAMPFFWSSSAGTIKEQSVTIIIGTFFNMKDVALYDLANKIIILPRMLTMSINSALFPKIIENIQKNIIKEIIRIETYIGFGVILGVILFGHWAILILGGVTMLDSYILAVILSITVLVWLVVGCYINFIFVPEKKYYFVTRNQFVAFGTFFIFCIPGMYLFNNIIVVVLSLILSGLSEIVYCNYLIKKYKLL